jgi:hypothetical protein
MLSTPTFLPPAQSTGPSEEEQTPNAKLARLSRHVPGGLGGVLLRDRTWVLQLSQPASRDSAVRALRSVADLPFPREALTAPHVERVRWTFNELYQWYRAIVRTAGAAPSLTAIDVFSNRIVLRVSDEDAVHEVVQRLAALSLPCDLVIIEVGPAPRLAS